MKFFKSPCKIISTGCLLFIALLTTQVNAQNNTGVGAKPPKDAEVYFDGTRQMLDKKWTYWQGPGFEAELPVKWEIVKDPVDGGTVMNSNDPTSAGGKYGSADLVTKKSFVIFAFMLSFLLPIKGVTAVFICKTAMKYKYSTAIQPIMVWQLSLMKRPHLIPHITV